MPVRPGDLTFAHVRQFVDRIVTVDDAAIADAGAVDLRQREDRRRAERRRHDAAVRSGALDAASATVSGPIVAIVSGGNMAAERLGPSRRKQVGRQIGARRSGVRS